MTLRAMILACLLLAVVGSVGCKKNSTPPAMPQITYPAPTSPLEVERNQLEEEKRSLSEDYSENIDSIQRINARLIQINIELHRQTNPQY
ncbi:hypothetical protein GTA51_07820 [Desulfovibrio aerotolerans]|uniref:Uncharacterized protein n=1 Tax=Solidesulfovibrio aerotolerans TaxID=295255 RepID=A0A7C9IUS1_9BACT|nr:hypothetical protein [Solidesulfovibrio aerotolerans]MYL83043.1 hypothetical protein [Solidesulfovibrio aerotolerans]